MLPRLCHCLLITLAFLISAKAAQAVTPTPTPTPVPTRTVSFRWVASPSAEVIGYKIFWGTGSGNYQNVRDVKDVTATSLTLSKSSQYYVAVAAYSMSTRSAM